MPETTEKIRTSDVVLMSEGHVLFIRRAWDPYQGFWALPGGHIDPGETEEAAARRELIEETGITADRLELIRVYGEPGRDPRGRYVSWAYLGWLDHMPTPKAGDDACDVKWAPLCTALEAADSLAFDHHKILSDAARILRHRQNNQNRGTGHAADTMASICPGQPWTSR